MNDRVKTTVVSSAMLVLCVIKPCAAAVEPLIITPVGAYASSVFHPTYSPQLLIDGSGLIGYGREATHTTKNISGVTWNSDISAPAAGQWVEFDLGASYDVTNALIWQLATVDFTSSGIQDYTISMAGPDHLFALYPAGKLTLARATDPSPAEPVQVVPLVAR